VNQQLIGLECQVVDNCHDFGLRRKDVLTIRTDPVTGSPSINGKGLETNVGMQNPVIRTGPADPFVEFDAEAVPARTLLDCYLCIIDELLPDETIRSAKHIVMIVPLTEITR
jgi:hypothetical protein